MTSTFLGFFILLLSKMSRKYYDKVLSGSGTSSVKVKSVFGAKILAKYGWKEGQGLGSSMNGAEECVQIERREERTGIGAEKKNDSEWDNWWSGAYDTVAARIAVKANISRSSPLCSSSDSHDEGVSSRSKTKKQSRGNVCESETTDEKQSYKKRRVKRLIREEA
jgi:hypothetical protein